MEKTAGTNRLKYTIALILGDWSQDGHKQTETVSIKSNLSSDEIMHAYEKASKSLGFNFINEVASDYEDNCLERDKLKALMNHGLSLKKMLKYDYDVEEAQKCLDDENSRGIYLYTESYINIFLAIVKIGNENFKYRPSKKDTLNIGGYGLFT
jgi:hypothetical protein